MIIEREKRFGYGRWTIGQISAQIIQSESAEADNQDPQASTTQLDLQLGRFTEGTEFFLQLGVTADVEHLARYVLEIQGKWDLAPVFSEADLTEQFLHELTLGYRLDEIVAVANFKLADMANMIQRPIPAIDQEALDQIRTSSPTSL